MTDILSLISSNIVWVNLVLILAFIFLALAIRRRTKADRDLLRYYSTLMESYQEGNLESILQQITGKQEDTQYQLGVLQGRLALCEGRLPECIDRMGLVRYKAFPDVGGDLSFSLALLNQKGAGLVLTGIHSRSETRIYAKGVESFQSNHPLSEEERQAINEAQNRGRQ